MPDGSVVELLPDRSFERFFESAEEECVEDLLFVLELRVERRDPDA